MNSINYKKQVKGNMEGILKKVEEALKSKGFGVLTRIDFDKKMKEKLNKDLKPVIILGACNPPMAFEAYQKNTDMTSLIPCNVVLRELEPNLVSVEFAKPSSLLSVLGDSQLTEMAKSADESLRLALELV